MRKYVRSIGWHLMVILPLAVAVSGAHANTPTGSSSATPTGSPLVHRSATPGSPATMDISVIRRAGQSYVDAVAVGEAVAMEFKVVQPSKLATYCSAGEQPLCIPVPLNDANFVNDGQRAYLSVDAIRAALSVTLTIDGDRATIKERPQDAQAAVQQTGYNADWPTGRGFRPGDTVPDIPLTRIDGREVRFSEFLGKRYILYCWASW